MYGGGYTHRKRLERRKGGEDASSYFERMRADIAHVAAQCFEEKGVRATQIIQIAQRCQLTRELIYYYYANKGAIAVAVTDLYAVTMAGELAAWANRWGGEASMHMAERSASLRDLVATLRELLFDGVNKTPMHKVLYELEAVQSTLQKAAHIVVSSSEELDAHAFAFVMFGIVGMLATDAHMADADIARIAWRLA